MTRVTAYVKYLSNSNQIIMFYRTLPRAADGGFAVPVKRGKGQINKHSSHFLTTDFNVIFIIIFWFNNPNKSMHEHN